MSTVPSRLSDQGRLPQVSLAPFRSVRYGRRLDGKEFIDRAAKWARAHGCEWRVEPARGKGGHKLLFVCDRRTTVQTGEIPAGTFHNMLKQLSIPKTEF